jgi:release factor glutamine methyltransferase
VARENAAALGLAKRITCVEGAFPEAAHGFGPFDAIAANPPYIPSEEVEALQPEVRDFEPRGALDGGPDGLAVLRPLAWEAAGMLAPGGWLATEVAGTHASGCGQAERVIGLLEEAGGWTGIRAVADLAGIPRVVMAQRR